MKECDREPIVDVMVVSSVAVPDVVLPSVQDCDISSEMVGFRELLRVSSSESVCPLLTETETVGVLLTPSSVKDVDDVSRCERDSDASFENVVVGVIDIDNVLVRDSSKEWVSEWELEASTVPGNDTESVSLVVGVGVTVFERVASIDSESE